MSGKWDTVIERGLLAILLLIVMVPMIWDGKAVAAAGFIAFLLVPYGFGRLLWSDRGWSDWKGWIPMATGVAILVFLKVGDVGGAEAAGWAAVYAGLAVIAQIVAALLAKAFYRESDI